MCKPSTSLSSTTSNSICDFVGFDSICVGFDSISGVLCLDLDLGLGLI